MIPPVYPAQDPDEGAPAPAAGALPRFTREDPRYWDRKPRDHNARGLYRDGPQEAVPPANRIANLTRARCREQPETPAAARGRMQTARARALRSLAARKRVMAQILAAKRAA